MSQQYFYDNQFRRIILQLVRMFGEFQVQFDGPDGTLVRVPCMYGNPSLQASTILNQNTNNVMLSVPRIAVYFQSMKINRSRTQVQSGIQKQTVYTRQYNGNTGQYLPQQGPTYSVQKYMPIPIDLVVKVDIVTSNENQRFQLLEQILPLFNPSLEFQTTGQYLDWTAITAIELTDINYTSRQIPQGTTASDAPLDVATLTFDLPVWISTAANVTKANQIFKVIANMWEADGSINSAEFVDIEQLLLTKTVVTFNNYGIFVNNGTILLLQQYQLPTANGALDPGQIVTTTVPWTGVLDKYGNITANISQIRLEYDTNNPNAAIANTIVGTISYSSNANILTFNVDAGTIPVNTLSPIDNFVNPQTQGPGINLPAPITGTAYLLSAPTGSANSSYFATAWNNANGNLVANMNDIITYNGSYWQVSFDSANTANVQFVTNLANEEQYRWTGNMWTKSWEGYYPASKWSLVL